MRRPYVSLFLRNCSSSQAPGPLWKRLSFAASRSTSARAACCLAGDGTALRGRFLGGAFEKDGPFCGCLATFAPIGYLNRYSRCILGITSRNASLQTLSSEPP